MTETRAQTRPVIEYPIELVPPDIARFRDGNIDVRFVHSFEGAQPGPHLLITALVHGNEPAGAVALERLLSQGLRPSRGRLTLAFANVDAYARFDAAAPRASRWVEEDMNRVWSPDILLAPRRAAPMPRAPLLCGRLSSWRTICSICTPRSIRTSPWCWPDRSHAAASSLADAVLPILLSWTAAMRKDRACAIMAAMPIRTPPRPRS